MADTLRIAMVVIDVDDRIYGGAAPGTEASDEM